MRSVCDNGYFGIILVDDLSLPNATAAPNMICHPGSVGTPQPHIKGLRQAAIGEPMLPLFVEEFPLGHLPPGLALQFCDADCTPLASAQHICPNDAAANATADCSGANFGVRSMLMRVG